MEILQIISFVMITVAYAAMTFLTAFTYARLIRQERILREIRMGTANIMTITIAEHLKSSLDTVSEMKARFNQLVEDECFEEAERLRTLIDRTEQAINEEIRRFRENFGDSFVITTTKKNSGKN